jgi:hypothetical protein
MAYEAAVNALTQQDTTLNNLRNRTTALLATGALAASFAAGIGLIHSNAHGAVVPHWAAWILLALFFLVGGLSVFILWPVDKFGFGPDAAKVLKLHRPEFSTDDVLIAFAKDLTAARLRNFGPIKQRMWAFRIGALLLIGEVVVLVVALARS